MYIDEKTKEYLGKMAPEREIWKKRNSFYYEYLESFLDFLVPKNKRVYRVPFMIGKAPSAGEKYDYIIASDILGYVRDIERFLSDMSESLPSDGRIIITQYSALWEPILSLASFLHLRMPTAKQNWLSLGDVKNFCALSGLEVVKSGSKMLLPKYIPLLSAFFNKFVANVFPFSRLGLFHYVVARPKREAHMATRPSISIVVPARNEAGTIQKIIDELPMLGSFTEIIFVEGNSTDNTRDAIEKAVKNYKGEKKLLWGVQSGKGKGDAVRKGFDMASGDILSIYDADMTVPPEEMKKFYDAIVEGRGEFINGSRLVYPMEKQSMRILNFFGNKFFSFAFSAILGQPLKDTLCGTKVLSRKDYEDIKNNRAFFGDFDPFGDFDLLFGAAKLNRKIIDLPVHYRNRVYGETNISRWKHGWLLLKMTVFAMRKIKFI